MARRGFNAVDMIVSQGATVSAAALAAGVSRQRVYQILKRIGVKAGMAITNDALARFAAYKDILPLPTGGFTIAGHGEATRAGMMAAKARGIHIGRPKKFTASVSRLVRWRLRRGDQVGDISRGREFQNPSSMIISRADMLTVNTSSNANFEGSAVSVGPEARRNPQDIVQHGRGPTCSCRGLHLPANFRTDLRQSTLPAPSNSVVNRD